MTERETPTLDDAIFALMDGPVRNWSGQKGPCGCGNRLECGYCDIDAGVRELLASHAAVALGKLGGSAKSDAKARASRKNGLLGGKHKPKPGTTVTLTAASAFDDSVLEGCTVVQNGELRTILAPGDEGYTQAHEAWADTVQDAADKALWSKYKPKP